MELTVVTFIYLDFLLDPSFKKSFSENSTRDQVVQRLSDYFDESLDRKGYDYQKFEQNNPEIAVDRRPNRYEQDRRKIVREISEVLFDQKVFEIVHHPLFGISCDVNAERFVATCAAMRDELKIEGSSLSLAEDIDHWGLPKFKGTLPRIYRAIGGFYDPNKWEDSGSLIDEIDGSVELPLGDEIISVDADSPEVIELKKLGSELIDQLQSANDLGELSRDEASAAAGEIRQILAAFSSSKIRKRQVYEFARSSLRWIAAKGGEALVGALATAFLAAIALYFGYHI